MATFDSLVFYLQEYGVLDFLLPFLLVFTIIYAVSSKLPLIKDDKRFRVVLALTIGLLFVIPHVVGNYPLGYDPVQVLNEALPSVALVAVAVLMLFILLGLFGTEITESMAPIIAIVAIAFVAYIFGSSLGFWQGPYTTFSWWSEEVTNLIIIILVFGGVIWFMTKEPGSGSVKGALETAGEWLSKIARKGN